MSKKEYLDNKFRVFKIYGITPQKKHLYTAHHIIGRAEAHRIMGIDFNQDQKSNLFPMTVEEQVYFHRWQDLRDEGIVEPLPLILRNVGKFN